MEATTAVAAINIAIVIVYALMGVYYWRVLLDALEAAIRIFGLDLVVGRRVVRVLRKVLGLSMLLCGYHHAEVAVHALIDDLPSHFYDWSHILPSAAQALAAWAVLVCLHTLDRARLIRVEHDAVADLPNERLHP